MNAALNVYSSRTNSQVDFTQACTNQLAMPRPTFKAQPGAVGKVGIEPRGLALAVATGACLAAGYSLIQDHDERRLKKSVAGGGLSFLGCYLFSARPHNHS